ncbi:MAG: 1,4-dihydroxy-2-naphthoate octaprenyltransferase [Betaproteobacteria bacterium]|jgi:1,4-dihydroxy-2-naphthoate octaprenyltransferase|nr:1,4-dihydroxy-2-naphthoate octaprenyltransferase [Betaproteobacteria bacterium]
MNAFTPPADVRPGSLAAWLAALRPLTLPIAAIPVVAGTALAWSLHGAFAAWIAALSLAGALLVQVISNLQNDVGYTVRGGETGTRTGLPRATARGWLGVGEVRAAIAGAVVLAIAVGAPLIALRGWPVAAIVAGSIAAAYAYMGGPRPIAYTPYGEATVFAFFGVVALVGTIYAQAGTVDGTGWTAGVAFGLLAAAVLNVNNHRDIAHDASTGRRTMAVVLGSRGSRAVFRASVAGAFFLVPLIAGLAGSAWYLLPLALVPRGLRLLRDFDEAGSGHALTPVLFRTVFLEAAFGLLLAAGALLATIFR